MAQTQFTIFQNDGTVLQIPATAIDSLTYSFQSAGELASVSMAPIGSVAAGITLHATVAIGGGSTVTARGFCYGTAPDPTMADGVIDMGNGTGDMDSVLTNLIANTTYHVRAFATTAYGTAFSAPYSISLGAGGALQGNGVVDIDGNSYPSVIIGGKEWMAMNLRTTHYANGDPIPEHSFLTAWPDSTSGLCASLFQFNGFDDYEIPYGKHYNWYAVTDPREVCPAGWHLPTGQEMWDLVYLIDLGFSVTDNVLMNSGPEHWGVANTATNATGFNAVPAGVRVTNTSTVVWALGEYALFWSSTSTTSWDAQSGEVNGNSNMHTSDFRGSGLSVRCVRN